MLYVEKLKLATQLFIYTFVVFLIMQAIAIATGGGTAQEAFETFANPQDYTTRLIAAGPTLRLILLVDVFFIIGYSMAIGLTAHTYSARNLPAAWVAGLGILLVVGLDLVEDTTLFLSLDMAEAGLDIPLERILMQANISGLKWLTSAIVLVAFTFVLPQDTPLERLLVWLSRIALPVGTGLFVTGALDQRVMGGEMILLAMAGGLGVFALTFWIRLRKTMA